MIEMNKFLFLILYFFYSFAFSQTDTSYCVIENAKSEIISIIRANEKEEFNWPVYFQKNIHRFVGRPYGGDATGLKPWQTLVATNKLNCVTIIELFWGLACVNHEMYSKKLKYTDGQIFDRFLFYLREFRYYEGANCEYADRTHYFTDALRHLEMKGKMFNVACANGISCKKNISYISSNYKKFSDIKNWPRIKSIEKDMSAAQTMFYPLEDICNYNELAKTGDIVALATNVPGLDVSHCGIVTERDGIVYFSHASSVKKKVVFEENLEHYLRKRDSITGIYVFRPIFK